MTTAAAVKTEPLDSILLEEVVENGIVQLTLNRPKALNALSSELIGALQDSFDRIADDISVKVVILAAAGRAFSPGHDLKELRSNPEVEFYRSLMAQCSAMMTRIQTLPQPVIAKVHAAAYAAGCQLVASADLAVAAQGAVFCTPGVNIGLFCSTPMIPLSRNLGRKQTMEMLLTGDPIDAATAKDWGLVNRTVPAEDLDRATLELARQIASKSTATISLGKEAFYRQLEMPITDAYAYASDVMVQNMLHRDAEEGIDAFIQKRPPEWHGR